jgi:hypothetical protein
MSRWRAATNGRPPGCPASLPTGQAGGDDKPWICAVLSYECPNLPDPGKTFVINLLSGIIVARAGHEIL